MLETKPITMELPPNSSKTYFTISGEVGSYGTVKPHVLPFMEQEFFRQLKPVKTSR